MSESENLSEAERRHLAFALSYLETHRRTLDKAIDALRELAISEPSAEAARRSIEALIPKSAATPASPGAEVSHHGE